VSLKVLLQEIGLVAEENFSTDWAKYNYVAYVYDKRWSSGAIKHWLYKMVAVIVWTHNGLMVIHTQWS